MAVAEVLITAGKQSLAGEENQRSDREATGYNRFVISAKHRGSRASHYKEDMFETVLVYGRKMQGLYL